MSCRDKLGGVIHTYQKYDPVRCPSPTAPPPDIVSGAFEHLLMYGNTRQLTPEQLANAVRLDPSQIQGLGPGLDALMQLLRERRRKILETYETDTVVRKAAQRYADSAAQLPPKGTNGGSRTRGRRNDPRHWFEKLQRAVREEQIRDLEQLWYSIGDDTSPLARQLVQLLACLSDKYQIDELASAYGFTGRTGMTIPEAIEIKQELEAIDRLLKQLKEAAKNAQIALIDLDELAQFVEEAGIEQLRNLQQKIDDYVRLMGEQQGLEQSGSGLHLTPKAYRLFQSKLLERIYSALQSSRSGRHQGPIAGEGATLLSQTKPYEFGDSVAEMDIPSSLINAMIRSGGRGRLRAEDIVIHRTRNNPKCATVVLLDMSGSMRYGGMYINAKRMALALDGLIRSEFPGDLLRFIEMYSFAKPRPVSEVATLLPRPVTLYDPVVRLKADMSDPGITELSIPPHFTNIQHGLRLARTMLAATDTPNRQVILITDGLPTAHFEDTTLYLLYPPDPRTEQATMREGGLCAREGITINMFLLPSWSQTREDIQFANHLAQSTRGRVFFTSGDDLDRYVVWDYLNQRREVIA